MLSDERYTFCDSKLGSSITACRILVQVSALMRGVLNVELPQEEVGLLVAKVLSAGDTSETGVAMDERSFRRFYLRYMDDEHLDRWTSDLSS